MDTKTALRNITVFTWIAALACTALTGCNASFVEVVVEPPTDEPTNEVPIAIPPQGSAGGVSGTLDPTFGVQGIATVFAPGPGNLNAYGRSGTVQADGKLLMAGSAGVLNYLVRLQSDGTLDLTFGAGTGYTTFDSGVVSSFLDVIVQPDQKILLAGVMKPSANVSEMFVARYLPNGTLDNQFGGDYDANLIRDGFYRSQVGAKYGGARKVLALANGSIVLSGYFWNEMGTITTTDDNEDLALLKLTPQGDLDTNFGTAGLVRLDLEAGSREVARDLAEQPDGKIVVVGSKYKSPSHRFTMLRLLANGALDTTFADQGILLLDSNGWVLEWNAVTIQGDGKIVAVGNKYFSGSGPSTIYIHRFNVDGTPDAGFGTGGLLIPSFPTQNPIRDFGMSVEIDGQGRIVVGGQSFRACASLYTGIDVAVMRYNANGTIDSTFGNNLDCSGNPIAHVQAWQFDVSQDYALDMAIQPDGNIVIFGHTDHASGGVNGDHDMMVMRFRQ